MHSQNSESVHCNQQKKRRLTKEKTERPVPMKKTIRQKMFYTLLLMVTCTMTDTVKLQFH
jgi:hypothetical protein